jgi:coproporphyrinogen III oxidase-like Fe-S oxidoreductase
MARRVARIGRVLKAWELYGTKIEVENVYVHLPFCQRKCHFCAFPVHALGSSKDLGM